MIYEFRTYNLNVGKIPEYHQIFSKKIIRRQEYSKIQYYGYFHQSNKNEDRSDVW